jgi:hypothetical protein
MRKTRLLFIMLFLSVTASFLFGMPLILPSLYAKNMTDLTITINREIAPSEGVTFAQWERYFITELNEMVGLFVRGDYSVKRWTFPIVLRPGESKAVFQWYPFQETEKIPPLEKLKLFHSFFIVKDDTGNILKTLDSFTENDFTFDEYGNTVLLIQ